MIIDFESQEIIGLFNNYLILQDNRGLIIQELNSQIKHTIETDSKIVSLDLLNNLLVFVT